jgi:hypothetical protein
MYIALLTAQRIKYDLQSLLFSSFPLFYRPNTIPKDFLHENLYVGRANGGSLRQEEQREKSSFTFF